MTHTQKQIEDIVRGIDAVMVLGTGDLRGVEQAVLEIHSVAVYLAAQISTYPDETDREKLVGELMSSLRVALDARSSSAQSLAPVAP